MDTGKYISKKVKRFRQEKGWTQEVLAEKAELTSRTIINVENGKGINLGTLTAIADALGCPVIDFFQDT